MSILGFIIGIHWLNTHLYFVCSVFSAVFFLYSNIVCSSFIGFSIGRSVKMSTNIINVEVENTFFFLINDEGRAEYAYYCLWSTLRRLKIIDNCLMFICVPRKKKMLIHQLDCGE